MEGILLWRKEILLQRAPNPSISSFQLALKNMSAQTETKESKWDMPDELLLLLEKVEKESQGSQLVLASSMYGYCYIIP